MTDYFDVRRNFDSIDRLSEYFNMSRHAESFDRLIIRSEEAKVRFKELVADVVSKFQLSNAYRLPPEVIQLLRIARISCFTAVLLGTYGAHVFRRRLQDSHLREMYNTALYYHLMHSAALFGLPFVRQPVLTGSLWLGGTLLYCGTMYYHAFTGDDKFERLTPLGGVCLSFGWLSTFF